jgi:diguanylate cyclase (GGDEF)-like protein
MKRTSPLTQMTLALVAMAGALVVFADLFFGVLPDKEAQARQWRKSISETLAVQAAALLQGDDRAALERTLASVAQRVEGVRSIAVRRSSGELMLQTGEHDRIWRADAANGAQRHAHADQVSVPLQSGGERWGAVEIAFQPPPGHPVWRWLTQPLVLMMMFIGGPGMLVFGLYMRRALQHLDPKSVIPERVQGAFDAMAEGVVVLDNKGRVLLANKAFRALNGSTQTLRTGASLSALPWLAAGLPADAAHHPWVRAMAERSANTGHTVEVPAAEGGVATRKLVINCSPVLDGSGGLRGCLATFDDTTELHRTNEQLKDAMAALSASKDEIERKNAELLFMATRDPMTGCLNRRSFNEQFAAMLRDARASGEPLSCAVLDIDHFKSVNDTHGHGVGDRVIQEVAKKLQQSARATDLVCRYGGEEFVVAVPGVDSEGALALAERVRVAIEQECGPGVREVDGLRVTVSIGVETLSADIVSTQAMIDRADLALYQAKRSGRNRVCLHQPAMVEQASAGAATAAVLAAAANAANTANTVNAANPANAPLSTGQPPASPKEPACSA